MRIKNLYPGSWGSNCFLLISGTHAAIVDPSACAERILDEVKAEGAQLEAILLTHGHFDHTVSMDTLREKTGISKTVIEILRRNHVLDGLTETNQLSFF